MLKRNKLTNLKVEEALTKDGFQYIHIKAKLNQKIINIFTKIYITNENKKIYIDKIKSLNLEVIQELYDTRNSFDKHSNFIITKDEYNSK